MCYRPSCNSWEGLVARFGFAFAPLLSLLILLWPAPSRAQAEPPLLLRDVRILDLSGDAPRVTPGMAVLAGGRYLDRAALDRLLAAAAQPDLERTRRNVIEGLTAQGADIAALTGAPGH